MVYGRRLHHRGGGGRLNNLYLPFKSLGAGWQRTVVDDRSGHTDTMTVATVRIPSV